MRVEPLGLSGELEPGASHRLVVLVGDAGARCDAADALRKSAEGLIARIPPREAPRDPDVALVREVAAVDAPGFEVV